MNGRYRMNSSTMAAITMAAIFVTAFVSAVPMHRSFAAKTVNVDILPNSQNLGDKAFSPNPVKVDVGDSIIWTNKDTSIHTATSGTASTPTGKFDTGILSPNVASKPLPISEEGEYPYYCMLHPAMVGTVIAGAGANGGGNAGTFEVKTTLDGKDYTVTGKSTTVKATELKINPGQSVQVMLQGTGDVELTLPTTLIEGINSVKAANQTVNFTPTPSENATTIKFSVPAGTTSVEIMGAKVIPEFPMVAAALIAASLIAIVGFVRFTRKGSAMAHFSGRG